MHTGSCCAVCSGSSPFKGLVAVWGDAMSIYKSKGRTWDEAAAAQTAVIVRTVTTLGVNKPHILKAKGGSWHVAYLSTVSKELIHAAINYRNNHLEQNRFAAQAKAYDARVTGKLEL